jgi:hypothetical protein
MAFIACHDTRVTLLSSFGLNKINGLSGSALFYPGFSQDRASPAAALSLRSFPQIYPQAFPGEWG